MSEFKTAAEIVKRLRSTKFGYGTTIYVQGALNNPDGPEAADLIDSQAKEIEGLKQALREVRNMTDAEDPDSYRCDDREGCLEAVFETAARALLSTPSDSGGAG